MTDGQVKYQTLMENQRHNREVERFNAREVSYKEAKLPYEIKNLKAEEGRIVSSDFQEFSKGFSNVAKMFKDAVGAASGIGALFG